jgi:hypothetical protein
MGDWYETCISALCFVWYGYVIIMGINLLFQSEELIDIPIAFFCTWILIALPAIIRGRW